MNLGKGFQIPQENGVIYNGDPWIPVTPEKLVMPTTNPIPDEMPGSLTRRTNWQEQVGIQSLLTPKKPVIQPTYPVPGEMLGDQTERTYWSELLGLYTGVLQETPSNEALRNLNPTGLLGEHNKQDGVIIEANGCLNQNAGSYIQSFTNDAPVRNNNSLIELFGNKYTSDILPNDRTAYRSIHAADKRSSTGSYPPVGNRWTEFQSASSMLLEQKHAMHPNQRLISSSLQEIQSDGYPVPYRSIYNLNSPPRAETAAPSCATNCFQFAPVTPDQRKQLKNDQLCDTQNFSIDESLRQGKDKQAIVSTNSQIGNPCDELLHSVITSPFASNLTTQKGKNISDDGGHGSIDLNKTPQQRPPKRKKHRPKVVREGKPKRTPKPTAAKANISNENPSGKRKYVRRKGLDASTSGQQNETNGLEASGVTSVTKSCRRVLNFDVEDNIHDKSENWTGDNQAEMHLQREPFDLNLISQDTTGSTGFKTVSEISAAKEGQLNGHCEEKLHCKSTCNLIHANNQRPAEKSLPLTPTAPPVTVKDHTLNVIARSLNLKNATACQSNDQSGYIQGHQHIHREGIDQMILQANATSAKLDAARQLMLRTPTASFKEMAEVKEKGGSKRDYCHTSELTNPQTVDLMHSQFSSHELSKTSQQKNHISKNDLGTPENHKRKKFEDKCHGVASSLPSSVTSVQDCSGQAESRRSNQTHASSSFSSYIFGRLLNSNFEKQSTFRKQNIGDNVIGNDQCTDTSPIGNGFQEQRSSSKVIYPRDWMVRQENMETDGLTVITRPTDSLMFSTHRVPETTQGNETRTSLVDLSVKRQTVVPVPSIQAFSKKKVHPEESKKEIGSRHSSRKVKGPKEEQNRAVTIDEIIDQMEGLGISNSGKEVVVAKHQNAIVPYKGDGTIVPYKGFDPIKRRRPRPKVDLDSETNRLWNHLMGKAVRESTESMDMDKEKWWEEERKVVRGRVDSFIARMHLVQGDRRFSQWKGSVVDSVIGVFLTQNVSDHLSSSAFMSLAAKFPLPPTTLKTTCSENVAIAWIEEPEGQIIDPDGTITYHGRMVRQVFYKQNSLTLSESSERRSENLISGIGTYLANENNSGTEEEVVSSQNSSDSFLQPTDIRSSSDSEVEDQTILCNSSMNCSSETLPKQDRAGKYPCHLMTSPLLNKRPVPGYQLQENSAQNPGLNSDSNVHGYSVNSDALCLQGSLSPSCGSWLNKTSRIGVHEPYCSGSSGHKRMTSFLPMSVEIAKTGGAAHSSEKIGGMAGSTSSPTILETGMPINHAMKWGQPIYPNQYSKDNLQPGSHSGSSQQSINNNHVHRSNSLQLEKMSVIEPKRPDEANANGQTGHVSFLSQPFSSTDTNIPNARKRKHEVDKTKTFDWDSLRKQVLSKGGKKERGQDNMDSLDYEAIRNADVKRISETIKERGMNNMLAERIKDFLNRLVREHGSIDLEWLRDVQSDQAKDYLLSIRGLGLKSVECVRLLTLHQLAFPVDTNVGRIAVRLGWVPLQPLPESLQLHLLELYPVLESIQKYLWPRLCKLDQRTLYELHYQMITFGKVFCTKSKPNCNACPMRAECRHFASAFASARLALPGPGERSVVCSTTSNAANDNLSVTLKPMPLPPGEANEGLESHYIRGICEPIIEEPTTPEPSPEVSEIDIEDLCYEDPDEIPIIKLSFEELKMNVQSIMEDQKMEFQEGDLSRALVALDPSAASIPAPKLKNVSRLRTEHQVYELPDSHPLLKGMDRREPDDPSPYLLAIWTPGETANSTQAPESECSSQASGRLCNEKGCFSCNSIKEANSQTVRGTLLIPCRTAMRGSFPLNGTYFQVNEMFADDESSQNPIDVPRDWLWPLPRRTVYFGTSVSTIFKGLSTEGIQYCFWKGFVCVRGFDRKTRAPRPLKARLHHPASKMVKNKNKDKQKERQS